MYKYLFFLFLTSIISCKSEDKLLGFWCEEENNDSGILITDSIIAFNYPREYGSFRYRNINDTMLVLKSLDGICKDSVRLKCEIKNEELFLSKTEDYSNIIRPESEFGLIKMKSKPTIYWSTISNHYAPNKMKGFWVHKESNSKYYFDSIQNGIYYQGYFLLDRYRCTIIGDRLYVYKINRKGFCLSSYFLEFKQISSDKMLCYDGWTEFEVVKSKIDTSNTFFIENQQYFNYLLKNTDTSSLYYK